MPRSIVSRYGPGSPGTCPAARNAITASDVTDVASPNPPDSQPPSGFWLVLSQSSARCTAASAFGSPDGGSVGTSCARAIDVTRAMATATRNPDLALGATGVATMLPIGRRPIRLPPPALGCGSDDGRGSIRVRATALGALGCGATTSSGGAAIVNDDSGLASAKPDRRPAASIPRPMLLKPRPPPAAADPTTAADAASTTDPAEPPSPPSPPPPSPPPPKTAAGMLNVSK